MRFLLLVLLALALGCGEVKEKLSGASEAVQSAIDETVKQVEEATGTAGHVEVNVGTAVRATTCYAKLHTFQQGRPSVLHVTSYEDPEAETYPALMMQGHVNAQSLEALVGQTVDVEVYAASASDGPVWHSPTGEPVKLRLAKNEAGLLSGEFVGGNLVNTETRQRVKAAGSFVVSK